VDSLANFDIIWYAFVLYLVVSIAAQCKEDTRHNYPRPPTDGAKFDGGDSLTWGNLYIVIFRAKVKSIQRYTKENTWHFFRQLYARDNKNPNYFALFCCAYSPRKPYIHI
jgi:hypothetical protein